MIRTRHNKFSYQVFVLLLAALSIKADNGVCAEFMRGADISIQTRQEADGVVYNEYGVPKDVLTIFKNHDLNWIRIRIFNNPSGSPYGVCQDLAYVTTLGARVKAEGFKFLLDFHYSDTWADPGNQTTPAAWASYNHSQLVTAVHDYTRDVIAHLRDNNAMPDMVQIGNEIINGMLWPDGEIYGSGSWPNFVGLINAGISGVNDGRGAEPMPKIMIHIDRGGDWSGTQWFFDTLISYGVQFDVIGQSFYPEWHGTLDDLEYCLNNTAARYSQDIVVAEAGDYYTGSGKTPESQKAYLEGVIQRVQDVPNGKGIGVFYWEPTWVWNAGGVSGRALFEPISGNWKNVNMLMAMEAFDSSDDLIPPDAPTGLSATGGESMVSLNWDDNSEPDLAGYNVYRSLTSGSGYVKINSSLVTSSDYIDNDVDGYVTYYYVVRAVDTSQNESGNSNQASATPTDTTPPTAPTGLTAVAGDGMVTLNWNDNGEDDLDGYNVYRSTTPGGYTTPLNGSLLTSSDYVDNSVTNGITYYYVVTAVDTSLNESTESIEVSATPQLVTDVDILGSWISGTTHTKEPGTNRALVFFVHAEHSNTGVSLDSVTYGGRTMTKVIDQYLAGTSTGVYIAAFILNDANIAAADSSGTFNPSWTGTPTGIAYSSVFLRNVNQTVPVGNSAGGSGIVSTITTSALSTNDGDLVIEAATSSSTGSFTLNNGFIEVNEYTMSASDGADGHKAATGAAETPSISHSITTARKVLIGFVVKAAPYAPPNIPPTVSITSPSNGDIFAQNANITIDATASDTDGAVTKVEFYQGATKLGEDTNAPYSYTWNTVPTGLYTLTAIATDDDSNTTASDDVNIIVLGGEGTGAVLSEWWTGITGTAVSDLTSDVNYPDNPSGEELLITLEGPVNWADNYGTRIRGYLNPVTTGSYTFWIASDADSELWLSTDDNPASVSLIAYAPGSTQSSPISLAAGQKYYIEVLHKEGTGNDNISVSWQGPGITQQVIDGIYLSPCCLDFENFADFAAQWNLSGCNTGNDWCYGFDFGRDGLVSIDDLNAFADAWLAGIE